MVNPQALQLVQVLAKMMADTAAAQQQQVVVHVAAGRTADPDSAANAGAGQPGHSVWGRCAGIPSCSGGDAAQDGGVFHGGVSGYGRGMLVASRGVGIVAISPLVR